MKTIRSLIPAALVIGALGAAGFFYFTMRRILPERPRGAELAPAGTMVFVQIPNLRQTGLRIPRTNLYRIWQEREVQAFLEKPRRTAPWAREWERRFEAIEQVAPGEIFVGITSLDAASPAFVGGFAYAGSGRDAKKLARDLRRAFRPGGRVVSTEANDGVETYEAAGGSLVSCFRGNWCLFASERPLLDAMLDRFAGKAGPGLAGEAPFQQAMTALGAGADLMVYSKSAELGGRPVAAMATRIDGEKMRDAIFLAGIDQKPSAPLSRSTLKLASPEPLAVFFINRGLAAGWPEPAWLRPLLPIWSAADRAAAAQGLHWSDLGTALGGELGAIVEWSEEAAIPTVLLGAEVRDQEKARAFADAITVGESSPWTPPGEPGDAIFTAPPQKLAFVQPAVALTDGFALLGLSREAVAGVLPRLRADSAHRPESRFHDALRSVPPEAAAFAFLDTERLLARTYRMARPLVTLSIAFSEDLGQYIDAGKLPPAESIAKHIGASILSQTHTDAGTVIESVGTLTIPQVLFLAGAGGLASAPSLVEGLIPKPSGKVPQSPGREARPAAAPRGNRPAEY